MTMTKGHVRLIKGDMNKRGAAMAVPGSKDIALCHHHTKT